MDKNPKHPLKKKKAVQKVCATANHNAQEVEAAAPKSKKHTYKRQKKRFPAFACSPKNYRRQVRGIFLLYRNRSIIGSIFIEGIW